MVYFLCTVTVVNLRQDCKNVDMKTFVGLPTARRGCLMRPSCCKIHTRMRGLLTLKWQ